ncbi:MAG: hypothetical protein H0X45_04485 [Planctomycetes bacterium]|nr:hypothetical protein [Planctomycetota bacterium]
MPRARLPFTIEHELHGQIPRLRPRRLREAQPRGLARTEAARGVTLPRTAPRGRVRVVAHDPLYWDSTYDVLVEGLRAFEFRGIGPQRPRADNTVDVQVDDGRLTLRNGPAARNGKLSFVELVAVPSGPG